MTELTKIVHFIIPYQLSLFLLTTGWSECKMAKSNKKVFTRLWVLQHFYHYDILSIQVGNDSKHKIL